MKSRHHLSTPRFQNWNIKKAKWNLFRDSLTFLHIKNLPSDVKEANTCITKAIITSTEKAIPKLSFMSNKKSIPRWNQECHAAVKTKNRALNMYKKHTYQENLAQFKITRAKARIIIESKKKCWQKFVSSINLKTSKDWKHDQQEKF